MGKLSSVFHRLFPLKSAPYKYFFNLNGLPKCSISCRQTISNSLLNMADFLFYIFDWTKAWIESILYIFVWFATVSATRKYFKSLTDTIGEKLLIWFLIYSHFDSMIKSDKFMMWSFVFSSFIFLISCLLFMCHVKVFVIINGIF